MALSPPPHGRDAGAARAHACAARSEAQSEASSAARAVGGEGDDAGGEVSDVRRRREMVCQSVSSGVGSPAASPVPDGGGVRRG